MRRSTITLSAALMLLAFAPASALARHHHRRHHRRAHHARVERFGRDVTSGSMSSSTAGTVQSFSGGRLTILLNDGSTANGQVTNDTELECTASEQSNTIHADGDTGSGDQSGDGDNSGSGDDQGQSIGGQSSGDDQGDTAEQNDDQAGDQNDDQAEDQNDNQAEDQNEDQGEDENGDASEENCSTMSLTPGTVVREAELRITSAGSVWKKVELGS